MDVDSYPMLPDEEDLGCPRGCTCPSCVDDRPGGGGDSGGGEI